MEPGFQLGPRTPGQGQSIPGKPRGWDQQEDRAQSCVLCWPRELAGRAKWGVLGGVSGGKMGLPQLTVDLPGARGVGASHDSSVLGG